MNLLLCIVIIQAVGQTGSSEPFPVPRAQREFAALGPHVRGYCHSIEGNEEAFRRAVLPFGPMDLTVMRAPKDETVKLRNLYLGFVGSACRVDAGAMAASFECGGACTAWRRAQLMDKFEDISRVADGFRKAHGIDVMSQWAVKGEFRINNVFAMMGQVNEAIPSVESGLVPSDRWNRVASVDAYESSKHIHPVVVESLRVKMVDLSLAALVREREWIRVIRVGIGLKESGLLFLSKGAKPPVVGTEESDGRKYVVVERVRPTVVFYETE